jgi:hypothetical protein
VDRAKCVKIWGSGARETVTNSLIVLWPQFELYHVVNILLFVVHYFRLKIITAVNNTDIIINVKSLHLKYLLFLSDFKQT